MNPAVLALHISAFFRAAQMREAKRLNVSGIFLEGVFPAGKHPCRFWREK